MHRQGSRTEGERRSGVLGSDDFDLDVILNDGLDGVVKHTGDGDIHGFLLGHDVAGIAVLDIALKDAGRVRSVRCMRCVRRVGRLEVGRMPRACARMASGEARRGRASDGKGRSSAVLPGANG